MGLAEAGRLGAMPRAEGVSEAPGRKGLHALDWRVGGVLLGLLVAGAVGVQGPLGVSTAYVTTDAMVAAKVDERLVSENHYLSQIGATITPEFLAVIGIVIGALLASLVWGTRTRELPNSWTQRFGPRRAARFFGAFLGGALLLFGARLAGGCTSGHVISGMSQLALSGMVFAAAVFASGIPAALLVYRRNR